MRCFIERSFVAQQTINIQELRAGSSITIWNKCGLTGWLLGALAKLRKRLLVMSVCLPAWNNSAATGRIGFGVFLENLRRKLSLIKIGQECRYFT